MNRIIQTICAYLCIFSTITAHAAGPILWGGNDRAQNLTTNGITLASGVTLDNDGLNNFVKASTAETATQPAAWTTYADAAQATPENCTAGSANITWTRNTTTPLRGAADFKLTKDGSNRQGQGVAYAFTTGPSDGSGELLTVSMPVKATEDAAYATGDIGIYVYNVTGAALITPTIVNVEDAAYQFTAQFNLASSTSYRLCIHVASANASAYDVYFDNITVGMVHYDWPGQINLVNSPIDATGWVSSAPSTITVATTTTSTDLPLGSPYSSSAIKITPISGTDYVRTRFTVPSALATTKLKAEWYQRPLSGYAAGDLKVEVYANASADCSGAFTELTLSTDSSGTSSIPLTTGKYTTTFDTTTASCYEIRYVRTAGTTALNITNVVVGPGIQPQGAVVERAYIGQALTLNNMPAVNPNNWSYQRVGDSLHIVGTIQFTADGVSASEVSFTLPNSLTTSTTRFSSGIAEFFTTGDGRPAPLEGEGVSGDLGKVRLFSTGFTAGIIGTECGTSSGRITNLYIDALIPINEWAGSGTVNLAQNDLMYVSNDGSGGTSANTTYSTGMQTGPGGSQFVGVDSASGVSAATTKYLVNWPYAVNQSSVRVQVTQDAGVTWVDGGGSLTYDGLMRMSTSYYGMAYVPVSSTSGHVYFGNKGRLADSTYGSDGAGWSGIAGSANSKWRVVAGVANQAVGFGSATSTSAGLVDTTTQTFAGNKTFTGTLAVTGATSLNSTAAITGTLTLGTGGANITAGGANSAIDLTATGNGDINFVLNGATRMQINDNSSVTMASPSGFTSNMFAMTQGDTGTSQNFFVASNTSESKTIITGTGALQNRTNSYGAISDERLKENIDDAPSMIERIMRVKVREYSFKKDKLAEANQVGVIAQELQDVFPEFVESTKLEADLKDGKAVAYSKFIPILLKVVQEQQAQINEMKEEVKQCSGF